MNKAIILLLAVTTCLLTATPGFAQADPARLSATLNTAAQNGASRTTLWNIGIHYFNEYAPCAELCRTIRQGYLGAAGTTPEQEDALAKAADYWSKRADAWGGDFDVSRRSVPRERPASPRGHWESTLPLKRPEGGGPVVMPRR